MRRFMEEVSLLFLNLDRHSDNSTLGKFANISQGWKPGSLQLSLKVREKRSDNFTGTVVVS